MSWNESGGNPQDPWKRGGRKNQGPPDLDELIKTITKKMEALFGGNNRRGGTNPGSPKKAGAWLVIFAFFAAAFLWAAQGFFTVKEAEQALVLRFGKINRVVGAGLKWHPPLIEQVVKVDTQKVDSHPHQASILTKDLDIVVIEIMVQYRVFDPVSYVLKVADAEAALRQATESALRHVAGEMQMEEIINEKRSFVATQVEIRLQEYLDFYESGLKVTKVNMEGAYPPNQVLAAFDDVTEAVQDRERLVSEAKAYRDGVVPEAEGKALRLEEEANAYKDQRIAQAKGEADRFEKLYAEYQKAPEVTWQRLYLETLEQVLQRSSKAIIDTEGSQNITYLPIDKLMSNQNNSSLPLSTSGGYGSQQHLGQSDRSTVPAVPAVRGALKEGVRNLLRGEVR